MRVRRRKMWTAGLRPAVAIALTVSVVACARPAFAFDKATAPVPTALLAAMKAKDMAPSAPVLLRSFKKESVIEVWKQTRAGKYALLKSFPICRWSGQLGPKRKTGDRQTPEGFYSVAQKQLNPNSAYYLSFDLGYPNAYDRAHGGTGAYLMVHGTCSSAGCYAMTDVQVGEIYALVRDALSGGQPAFQFQAFPFRMTADNLAKHRSESHYEFWRQLKEGFDRFEATGEEPTVSVVAGRYAFGSRRPESDEFAKARIASENERVKSLVNDGIASIRTTYSDGGQNAIFAAMLRDGASLGDVSRPEALAYAGKEIVVVPARKPALRPTVVEIATRITIDDIPRDKYRAPIAGSLPMLQPALTPTPDGPLLVAAIMRVKSVPAPAP